MTSTSALFDIDALRAQACEATGLDDLGEDTWRDGLEHLVDALEHEARLNEIGMQIVPAEIVGYFTTRLHITEWHRQHPEIGDVDIRPPIVIMGQPRTGTTILFDLLAQDPANRVPLTWEVDYPWPPPETATYETDPRIAEVQSTLEMTEILIPGFLGIHAMGAQLGQECVRITGGDFKSMIFPTQYRAPSYMHWLHHEADMAEAYRYHRKFLQHLQSRHPAQRWLLKSPAHLWSLDALLGEYPDALLVQTHRDPLKVVASLASLTSVLRRLGTDEATIPEMAEELVGTIVLGLDRSVDARTDGTVPRDQAIDVLFADFMADPMVTVQGIYDRLGIELTAEAESAMRTFMAENPQDKHGGHRYTFEDTGLDAGELRERVQRYQDHFGVPDEARP
jgi:hypothetical protein